MASARRFTMRAVSQHRPREPRNLNGPAGPFQPTVGGFHQPLRHCGVGCDNDPDHSFL